MAALWFDKSTHYASLVTKRKGILKMQMDSYLPLTEYSSKYKVSISTLRRRIKADDIHFRFEEGKYFIADQPLSTHQRVHRPSQQSETALVSAQSLVKPYPAGASAHPMLTAEESHMSAANQLLTELKKAYSQILQEKEEQILNLKEEVTDLKTLVRVLESENDRLKAKYLG